MAWANYCDQHRCKGKSGIVVRSVKPFSEAVPYYSKGEWLFIDKSPISATLLIRKSELISLEYMSRICHIPIVYVTSWYYYIYMYKYMYINSDFNEEYS